MTPPAATAQITEIGTVFVPVSDQDSALDFYVGVLGFEKRVDFDYGGGRRWIEVAPPGASNTVALVPASEGTARGGDETRCAFATADIRSDHALLRDRGVDVDAEIAGTGTSRTGLTSLDVSVPDPVPAQFFFRDPDGNRFLMVQPG
jgi:catechol 2,3-dioxygenase-like lactoylglutathione lyase family enzyme